MGIKSLLTGDYGHEHRYVNGAHKSGYSVDRHVEAQCRDSRQDNQRREARGSAVRGAVAKTSGFLDWLSR